MRRENQEQRRQARFEFPGALDGEVMPESAKCKVQADEVRGPPASVDEAASIEADEHDSPLDPHRQVSTSAEELGRWRVEVEEKLTLFRSERERLEAAAKEYEQGGWAAVTSLDADEKTELKLQVERDLLSGKLPIPRFVPSYLSSSIKRLEERVSELDTLRPADEQQPSEPSESSAAPAVEEPTPNAYEQRVEARRERLEDAAAGARGRSQQHYERAGEITEHIPLGQPILRGHHSEKRHRAAINRSSQAMDRSLEEARKAKELEHRAKRVGTGGVSADDPSAVGKLQAKLEKMEEKRDLMKRVNKEFRKGGWDAVTGISDELREKLHSMMLAEPWKNGKPFQSYELTNLSANIRRVKERITALSEAEEREPVDAVEGDGYRLEEDKLTNRVRFFFDSKPSAEVRDVLKANSFRWAPSVKAWQRQASANGRAAGERVREQLEQLRG